LTKLRGTLKGRFTDGAVGVRLTLGIGSTVQDVGAVIGGGDITTSNRKKVIGSLALGNQRGQITLNIVGSAQLPTSAQYRVKLNLDIAHGTGVFRNLSGPAEAILTYREAGRRGGTFRGPIESI
jgi:hypothetical protein